MAEIIAANDDMFGWRREILVPALDYERAKPFLNDDVTAEVWNEKGTEALEESIRSAAVEYLSFAIGKMDDHRGLSASRSVDKMREFAWMLGVDDVDDLVDRTVYRQYGAPVIKAIVDRLGSPFTEVWEGSVTDRVRRMAESLPCEDGCEDGCSR